MQSAKPLRTRQLPRLATSALLGAMIIAYVVLMGFFADNPASEPGPRSQPVPRLDVVISNGYEQQSIGTIRGVTNWSAYDADGLRMSISSDSPHPLQLSPATLANVTLHIAGDEYTVWLNFSLPPNEIAVRRWPFAYTFLDDISDAAQGYTLLRVDGTALHVPHDNNDYIYEVRADWDNGWALFTFCTRAAAALP